MAAGDVGRLNANSQTSLVRYCISVLDLHKRMNELRTKMEFIDVAYARYKATNDQNGNGEDTVAGSTTCGVNIDEITVPIVVSQVDSYVAYLAEVYLSGYPIFPVVASPDNQDDANKLQSIIDDHSVRGRYPRQLLMNFRDAAKYNFTVAEIDWCPIDTYSMLSAYEQIQQKGGKGQKMGLDTYSISKINRIDPYNTLFDYRVHPVNCPYTGEYSGFIEIISRIELKRRLAYFANTTDGYHTSQILSSNLGVQGDPTAFMGYYTEAPQISNIISKTNLRNAGLMDWVAWLGENKAKGNRIQNYSDIYEFTTLYARIIPEEHGMDQVPRKGSPQVWKLCFVNHSKLVYAKRIFSIYDMLPMIISQPFEDGFDLQTESVAERGMPFQDGTSKLLSIRLNSARRAIMDRAIYDSQLISQSDINSPVAAPKIPMRANSQLGGKTIKDAYYAIPFDSKGTETVMQDMANLTKMADNVNGLNQPQQGQFQKGNKTRKEWNDTMANAGSRSRLTALSMEYQFFLPIKEQLKLNIYQYQVTGSFQNMKTGDMYDIKAEDLVRIKEKIGMFKVADGFTPTGKLASTDVLTEGMQLLSQSPILQQQLGVMLPRMFIHLMQLGGVSDIEQYLPKSIPPPGQPVPAQGGQVVPGSTVATGTTPLPSTP